MKLSVLLMHRPKVTAPNTQDTQTFFANIFFLLALA